MPTVKELWRKRFEKYTTEVQKYSQYIFTGHLVIVLLFLFGALGMAYSEWLKVVRPDFPSAWFVALLLAIPFATHTIVSLLREADEVYFLPLEGQLKGYFQSALQTTLFFSLPLPLVLGVVSFPLLKTTAGWTFVDLVVLLLAIVVLRYLMVQNEWHYRVMHQGQHMFVIQSAHFIFAYVFFFLLIQQWWLGVIALAVIAVGSFVLLKQRAMHEALPFQHLIGVEKGRMMCFYRFANYFTDVPFVQGKMKRRSYARWLLSGNGAFGKEQAYPYLLSRTFVRSDDAFRLSLRLIVVMVVFVLFIPSFVLMAIAVLALQFALVSQMLVLLSEQKVFRMDQLFPVDGRERERTIRQLVYRYAAVSVLLLPVIGLFVFDQWTDALILLFLLMGVTTLTIRLVRKK